MLKVVRSPGMYIQGEGEITHVCGHYAGLGKTGAYLLMDPFVFDTLQESIVGEFKSSGTPFHVEKFGGECSKTEVNRNIEIAKAQGSDVIIGFGGGKTLDSAKAIAYYLGIPVIVVPTIASTDAPCSALSVLYTDSGEFDEYLMLPSNPNKVIMDTAVIAKSPARLLVSGIGDALATYYEAKAAADANKDAMAGGKPTKAAIALAELCLNTLFEDGLKAKIAVENGLCTQAVENIIEANTYLSGVGFESGGLAAAHAIHNGFTILEECHHMFHGEKVAFGTITQLVLENRPLEEIESVIEFCQTLGLPTTLADLGLEGVSKERLYDVAVASTVPGETIHNMIFPVTAADVLAAILTADALGKELKG